jgi:hypothetical protein
MDIEALHEELRKAYPLASEFRGGYSERFDSAESFTQALGTAISQLEHGDLGVLRKVSLWFLPTSDWDDLVGLDGLELGQRVSDMLLSYGA